MKILIHTPFAPMVGGAEEYVILQAQGLSALAGSGQLEITVTTPTMAGNFDDSEKSFCVVRQPNLRALVSLISEADVIPLIGPCFLPMLVAWFLRKPVTIEHHGYPPVCPNGLGWRCVSATLVNRRNRVSVLAKMFSFELSLPFFTFRASLAAGELYV